jgi:membrane-associated phospholipid phosphatase
MTWLFAAFVAVFLLLWTLFAAVLPRLLRALHKVGNRGASMSMRYGIVQRVMHHASKFRDFLPVAIIVIAGALITAWTGDQFVDLAELVHAKSPALQQFDGRVHDWAVSERNSGATTFFVTMSTIGGPVGVAVITGVVAIALLIARRFSLAAFLVINVAGADALDWELKRYFARARPAVALMLRRASGYSFPSGHALGSTVLFAALSYLAIRSFPRWRWKAAALALSATLIVAVALSRVYLGVHWISDVAAGIVIGLLWVTTTTVAYETLRRIRALRSQIAGRGSREK